MNLLVLVHPHFNDIELVNTIACLKKANMLTKLTYYNPNHIQATGQYEIVTINLENEVDFSKYDALFIPGGKGAQELRKDQKSLAVIDKFIIDKKDIFAICDAPNVLYENGYLDNFNYSSFPIPEIENKTVGKRNEDFVTCDGKFITAKCAAAGLELGLTIVKEKVGEEKYLEVKRAMYSRLD
ncbi:DJ-1/PfpI family protein [Mycoplasmopsis hyopharyngis]|uniref:DJ-1/PfpI family protein n=1 Tax=Mycoplasmopsis hyopharyngis TaxID=29558 RepID=UPI003872DBB1